MPKDILHLLGTAQPEGSGIARIVAALAAGLDPSKYRLHAWFLGPPGPLIEDFQVAGATVLPMTWWRGARDPLGAWHFSRALRKFDFAIVHQHFGARSIRQAIRFSSSARLVVHLHGMLRSPPATRIPVAVRGADVVIAASHAVACGIPAVNPIVVYAGVPLPKAFGPNSRAPSTNTVIGTACRLVPLKGLLDLIRAIAFLRPEFPHLRLEIAGTGPQRDDLEREARGLGLTSCVRFLGWQPDLGAVFQNWDIFVLPSLHEGFGMAVVGAMAAGLPVVATSVGGLPELVEDDHTGFIVAPSDVPALTERLRLLLLGPERRRTMGIAGRERARTHFSVDRMVSEIAAIYDKLLLT
jgi:glycosyltransferase involved in cell wall biosynthesis